jgi:hypothetical protein
MAVGLALETLPLDRAAEFYEEATCGRSASHQLQVNAALAFLYYVLGSSNPFIECLAPKFAPEKTELRYHTPSQLGQLLRELREDKTRYFGHLTHHLATPSFYRMPGPTSGRGLRSGSLVISNRTFGCYAAKTAKKLAKSACISGVSRFS